MKIKNIKLNVLVIALATVLLSGMSIVGVGAATQKTYISTMGYSSFDSTCYYNNCSPFEGIDQHGNECTNAYQFYIDSDYNHYSNSDEVEKAGYCSYTVRFDLDEKYTDFNFKLTAGERLDTDTARISISGDGSKLYSNGITNDTNQIPVSIDVTGVKVLTFEISVGFTTYYLWDNHYIILNDAYFTGITQDVPTTVKPTEKQTPESTVQPTEKPTKVTDDTKPVVTEPSETTLPDSNTEKSTLAPSVTQETVKPQTGASSAVSTSDTATPDTATNNTTGDGFIKTGDIPLITIFALLIIGACAGTILFVRRRKLGK